MSAMVSPKSPSEKLERGPVAVSLRVLDASHWSLEDDAPAAQVLDRGAGGTPALARQSAVSENATVMVALAHFISCSIPNHQGSKRAMDYRVGERLQGNTQFWLENGQHHIYAYSHPLSMTPI